MKISFLIHNVYGIGGTNRTVINLAEALAGRHEVEIVSVFRRLDRTMFDISPRVSVVPLVDLRHGRPDRRHRLVRELSRLIPADEEFYRHYSALTDERITRFLQRTDADVVVGTRPGLNLCVARLAPDSAATIAQEHMTHEMIPASVRDEMRTVYPRLGAAVTVTEADAEVFRTTTPIPGLRVVPIPNSVPAPTLPPSDCTNKVVVAAGRLSAIKRYDLLVHAFAKVVPDHPDWTLRIYGDGPDRAGLAALIARLELYDNVFLMGRQSPLESEWVKGAIAAVTSDKESFGMTVVEAMRCGVPVVSTACPVGPPEIIEDGVDGLLVPVGDVDAIAGGLMRLIKDDELRQRMGRTARDNSRRFDPEHVAATFEALCHELIEQRDPPSAAHRNTLTSARRRLRRLVQRVRPQRKTPSGAPVADCVVNDTGEIAVTVMVGPRIRGSLLCRERGDKGGEQVVRAPFQPDGEETDGARLRAVVPARALTEGRWNLYLATDSGASHRLRAGVCDLRAMLGTAGGSGELVRHLPYRTADDHLAVRSWIRPRHAECTGIRYDDETLTVEGFVMAERFGSVEPLLTLTRRLPGESAIVVPGTSSGGGDFRFQIPVRQLAGMRLTRHDDWDLYLTTPANPAPVRIARLLDDVVERKRVYVYPGMRVDEDNPTEVVDESPATRVHVKPYFTIDSELSLVVTDR